MYKKLFLVAFISVAISAFSLYNQSVRLDESQSIWVATKTFSEIFRIMAQDVHPPLYMVLLHIWTQIFGTSVILARTLSLLFYLLTLPVIFLLAKRAANEKVALLSVIFFAFSPFMLWFSNEIRMYTLFTFAATLNNYFFLRTLETDRREENLSYLMSLILGLYTHYFFILVVLVQFMYILLRRRKLLIKTILSHFFAGLAFLPWILYVLRLGFSINSQPVLSKPTPFNILQTFFSFVFGFQNQKVEGVLVSLWPLIVVLLIFAFTARNRLKKDYVDYFLMATFLPIIMVFLISFFRPVFLSRYLIFVLPSLFFLISWAVETFEKFWSTLIVTTVLVVMIGLLLLQNLSTTTPVKEDYQETARFLEESVTPRDIVLISAPFTVYPIEFSYNGVARLATIPEWDRYKAGSTPAFTLEGLQGQMIRNQKVYERAFVVLSYDQGYESKIVDYFDNNFALLGDKTFSAGIKVRIYKLRYDISLLPD